MAQQPGDPAGREAPVRGPGARGSLAPGERESAGPSTGLLSFYDRLRERMLDAADRKSHKLGKPAVEALLLVPDVFILLVRLSLDREVPRAARSLIGGALAYFVLPVDLFPEAVLGAPGFLEDLVLASAVLAQAFGGELEPYARKHWNGDQELRQVLHDVADSAQNLLGRNLHLRLKRTLARRGVKLGDD
jgi:uncharacterized membrane protein YkvA (DUF1232 family)